jgi:selenocysteine lyase/cysteine desulfurase
MKSSQFQQALDTVEALSPDDQQALVELVQHRLAENRRHEIARHASDTLEAVRSGKACKGSLDDLKRDLLADL